MYDKIHYKKKKRLHQTLLTCKLIQVFGRVIWQLLPKCIINLFFDPKKKNLFNFYTIFKVYALFTLITKYSRYFPCCTIHACSREDGLTLRLKWVSHFPLQIRSWGQRASGSREGEEECRGDSKFTNAASLPEADQLHRLLETKAIAQHTKWRTARWLDPGGRSDSRKTGAEQLGGNGDEEGEHPPPNHTPAGGGGQDLGWKQQARRQ